MFKRLIQWLRDRNKREENAPSEPAKSARHIFSYYDGKGEVYADPVEVMRQLEEIEDFHPQRTYNEALFSPPARNGEPSHMAQQLVDEAWLKCVRAARNVFSLKPFDPTSGEGLTEQESIAVLSQFYNFIGALKKNTDDSQTPPQSTAATSLESTEKTTPSISPSSKTLTGAELDKLMESESELEQPPLTT